MRNKAVYIGVFGRGNQGKSSLVNALTGQQTAIVSEMAGTTTDPVRKSMEIFGIGPVVLVDTAGLDDTTALGGQRLQKTWKTLDEVDLALLVCSGNQWEPTEQQLADNLKTKDIPFVIVHNKSDMETLSPGLRQQIEARYGVAVCSCSAQTGEGVPELVKAIVSAMPESAYCSASMVEGIVRPGEMVALVMPQDKEAPEGRLILPQVQMIRDLLDHHAIAVPMQPEELPLFLARQRPDLVITDSQVFAEVNPVVPADIPLTSFSILLSSKIVLSDFLLFFSILLFLFLKQHLFIYLF